MCWWYMLWEHLLSFHCYWSLWSENLKCPFYGHIVLMDFTSLSSLWFFQTDLLSDPDVYLFSKSFDSCHNFPVTLLGFTVCRVFVKWKAMVIFVTFWSVLIVFLITKSLLSFLWTFSLNICDHWTMICFKINMLMLLLWKVCWMSHSHSFTVTMLSLDSENQMNFSGY